MEFGAAYDRIPHPDVGLEESIAEVRMRCCFFFGLNQFWLVPFEMNFLNYGDLIRLGNGGNV